MTVRTGQNGTVQVIYKGNHTVPTHLQTPLSRTKMQNMLHQREHQQCVMDSPEAHRLPAHRHQSSPPPFRLPGFDGRFKLI